MANKSLDLRLLEKTHILFGVEHLQIPCKGKKYSRSMGDCNSVVITESMFKMPLGEVLAEERYPAE